LYFKNFILICIPFKTIEQRTNPSEELTPHPERNNFMHVCLAGSTLDWIKHGWIFNALLRCSGAVFY